MKFSSLKKAIKELNDAGILDNKINMSINRKKKELTEDFCNAIEAINEADKVDEIPDFVFNFYNDNLVEGETDNEVEEVIDEKDEMENEVETIDEDIVEKEETEIDYNIADELSLDSTSDIKSDEVEKEPIEIDVVPEKKQKTKKKDKKKSEKKTKVEKKEKYTRIQAFCDALKGEPKTIKEISEKAKILYDEANPNIEQKGVERYTKILISPLIIFGFVILQNKKYSLKDINND